MAYGPDDFAVDLQIVFEHEESDPFSPEIRPEEKGAIQRLINAYDAGYGPGVRNAIRSLANEMRGLY